MGLPLEGFLHPLILVGLIIVRTLYEFHEQNVVAQISNMLISPQATQLNRHIRCCPGSSTVTTTTTTAPASTGPTATSAAGPLNNNTSEIFVK